MILHIKIKNKNLINSDQFNYTKDAQGRPVFNVNGSLALVAKT